MTAIRCPISLSTLVSQEFSSIHDRRKSSSSSQILDYSYSGVEMLDNLESRMFIQVFDIVMLTLHLVIGVGKIILELGWSSFQFLTSSIVYYEVDAYASPYYATPSMILSNRRLSESGANNIYNSSFPSSPSDNDLNNNSTIHSLNELTQDRRKSSLFDIPLMDIDAIIERVANELAEIIHHALYPTKYSSSSTRSTTTISNNDSLAHNKIEKTLSMQVIDRTPLLSNEQETVPIASMEDKLLICDSLQEVVQLKAKLNQFVFPPSFFSK